MASQTMPGSPPVPCTPAILQGGLAPWGPTPSPSPLIRLPAPHSGGEGCGSSASLTTPPGCTPEEPTREAKTETEKFTQELLVEICAPYIERMIQALYQAVEAQLEKQGLQAGSSKDSGTPASQLGTPKGSPAPQKQNDPFSSLFDPTARSAGGRRAAPLRKGSLGAGGPPGGAVFREEDEPQAPSSNASTPRVAKDQPFACLSRGQRQPQRQKAADQFISSSAPADDSLVLRPAEADVLSAAGGLGSRSASANASPIMPGIDAAQLQQMQQQPGDAGGNGGEGIHPLYLTWSQDDAGGQRWSDNRNSPVVPPAAQQQTGAYVLALGRNNSGQDGASPPASGGPMQGVPSGASAASSEKSVMVCRHWKSKGFCRMEANCKFLHPEHKRGTPSGGGGGPGGTAATKAGGAGQTGLSEHTGTAKGSGAAEAGASSGKSTATRTRRAGRGRHAAGHSSGVGATSMGPPSSLPPQAVAAGLLPSAGSTAAASSTVPPNSNGPPRHQGAAR